MHAATVLDVLNVQHVRGDCKRFMMRLSDVLLNSAEDVFPVFAEGVELTCPKCSSHGVLELAAALMDRAHANSLAALLHASLVHFSSLLAWWQAEPEWHAAINAKTVEYVLNLHPRILRVLMRFGLLQQHEQIRNEAARCGDADRFAALEPTLASFLAQASPPAHLPLPSLFWGVEAAVFAESFWCNSKNSDLKASLAQHYVDSVVCLGESAQTALFEAVREYPNKAWLSGALLLQCPGGGSHERVSWYALPFLVKHANATALVDVVRAGHFSALGRVLRKYRGDVVMCARDHTAAQAAHELCWLCRLRHCAALDYRMTVGVMALARLSEHRGKRKHRSRAAAHKPAPVAPRAALDVAALLAVIKAADVDDAVCAREAQTVTGDVNSYIDGETLLTCACACSAQRQQTIAALALRGADVHACVGELLLSPLHKAVLESAHALEHCAALRRAFGVALDVNVKTTCGKTPLYCARDAGTAMWLLWNGASNDLRRQHRHAPWRRSAGGCASVKSAQLFWRTLVLWLGRPDFAPKKRDADKLRELAVLPCENP